MKNRMHAEMKTLQELITFHQIKEIIILKAIKQYQPTMPSLRGSDCTWAGPKKNWIYNK